MSDLEVRILLVDDDGEALLSLAKVLRSEFPKSRVEGAGTPEKAAIITSSLDPHVVILDMTLIPQEGPKSGLKTLSALLSANKFLRVIVLTGDPDISVGVEALSRGASHFLSKPPDIKHLSALIKDAYAHSSLLREHQKLLSNNLDASDKLLIGSSSGMLKVKEQVKFASSNSQAVFLHGETGVGKGVCALAIHQLSERANAPFIRFQPSFASSDLALSELFGHKKGTFTGASENRTGLIARAEGGTLFIDEIDELPMEVQVALLGVLQEKKYRQLGSDIEKDCNVRIIAASNRGLDQLSQGSTLRKDLYHRIAHLEIQIPPLRERKEDIKPLVEYRLSLLRDKGEALVFEVADSAYNVLMGYRWPGNVRELEAVIDNAVYKANFKGADTVSEQHLTIRSLNNEGSAGGDRGLFHEQVESFKINLIKESLRIHNNNQMQAAKALGIERSSFRRMMKSIGLI